MHWHAIYTKPRWEKKVVRLLTEQNIANYCPMKIEIKQWKNRKAKVELPIISSYVFVYIKDTEVTRVRMVDGVINFVYFENKIAIIRDKEIELLKEFNEKYTKLVLEGLNDIVGKKIVITTGPFEGKKGTISSINKNTMELVLESLGVRLVVEKIKIGN
jgi:transcription antitermination factor NusG